MPSVDREDPQRGESSAPAYSLTDFMRECPDDAACLDMLWRERYAPDGHHTGCVKCRRERKFHRIRTRPVYCCDTCGHPINPLAGTIIHKSSTPLQLWFYATYLMSSARCGISAKQLERELGVTYKTAWRMFNKIRNQLVASPVTDRAERACGSRRESCSPSARGSRSARPSWVASAG